MSVVDFKDLPGAYGEALRNLRASNGAGNIMLCVGFVSRTHLMKLSNEQAHELGLWLIQASFENKKAEIP